MNVIRLILSAVAGLSAALIAFSAVYVRGDLGGVMQYLRARGAARRLEGNAPQAQVDAAHAALRDLGQQIGDPALAARLWPLELLVGVVVAVLVWQLFTRVHAAGPRPDIQERMLERFAHRLGGQFTLTELEHRSPLTPDQARDVTQRLLTQGRLTRSGDTYRLVPRGSAQVTP